MTKQKVFYLIIYSILICIIGFSIFKWSYIFKEEKDLIEYKVLDVVKDNNQICFLIELNQHYYIQYSIGKNVIFKHYKECPFCRKKFKPFIFSTYDGLNTKLQEKFNNLNKEKSKHE